MLTGDRKKVEKDFNFIASPKLQFILDFDVESTQTSFHYYLLSDIL